MNNVIERIKLNQVDDIELLEYVTDNDISIAIAAAESELATEEILDIAAHDKDSRVRKAAVCNLNIGKKTLEILLNDKDKTIAEIAMHRLERS